MEDFESKFDFDGFEDEDLQAVDALIAYLKELPRAEVTMVNPHRVEQMRFSAAMMKKVLRETGSEARFECKQHESFSSVGVVRIEGAALNIIDIEGFSRAAEFASNTEIYPLNNGKVRMTFTFHGLTIPVA